jgi:hypothetical protein
MVVVGGDRRKEGEAVVDSKTVVAVVEVVCRTEEGEVVVLWMVGAGAEVLTSVEEVGVRDLGGKKLQSWEREV